MKKAVGIILLSLLLAFGLFAGCSEKEQEPETTITMQESMELTLFETGLLTAQVSTGETAAFTSSDEGVVTVAENGAVTPQGAGEAVITAAAGGAEATCRVTVTVPENTVIRTVTDASLKLNVGSSLAITHYAMYGEQELEGGSFTFRSSDEAVASVSENGEVTGAKKGEAQITVGVRWKGVSLQESTVDVTVSDEIVFTLNQSNITLKRADDLISEGLESTFALKATVLLNGAEVSDPAIEVSAEPAGVVTVGEDLLLTAVSSGTAKLTLRYTSPEGSLATATAEVTVVRPVTAVPMGEAAEQGINRKYTYSYAALEGANIISATYGEENVAASVEGTQLSVSFAGIKADGSAKTLTVTAQTATDEYVFTRELLAVDFMIGTTEEFNAFISALADTSQYWYAELTDNIDFTGKELTRKMDDASRASASFSLDGNGYWVGNLYMEDTNTRDKAGIAVTAQTGSISVQNEKEQASEDLGEFAFAKNRAVTDPVEVTLAEGEQVRSLLDGETPAEAPQAQDGKVVFGTDFFAAQASGMHTYTLQVESMTKVTSYTFTVYLLDFKIGTTDEFEEFAAAVKEAGEGVILAELDDNLDYTGKTFTAFGSAVKHAYTLDGKGHYINGISSPSDGIFGNISTGQVNGRVTLRNIAITNISNPGDPAGLFSNGYNVELCDVFISYATVMGKNFTAPAVFAPINATLKNVVVVAQVDPSKDIGAISKAGETATTQYINCYAVSNATYLYPDAPHTNTLFADVAAMKAAVTGVPEGFNTEYWTQAASGLLTFKSVDALYDVTETLQMTQTAVTAEERTEVTISFGMSFTAEAGTLADPFAINQHQNFNYAGDSLMNYILIGDGQTQRSAYEICTDNANDITSYKPGAGWMSMGGIWAPVLVQVPADGSGIKVSVYTGYLAEGAFTVTLKAGWSWNTANGMTMRVTEDVTFGWQNGQFERI